MHVEERGYKKKKHAHEGKGIWFGYFGCVFSWFVLYFTLTFLYRDYGTLSLHLFRMLNFNVVLVRREL